MSKEQLDELDELDALDEFENEGNELQELMNMAKPINEKVDPDTIGMQNKQVILSFLIINVGIALVYLTEFLNGNRGFLDYIIIVALTIVPVVAVKAVSHANPTSYGVRYIVTLPFCILYGYIMLTTVEYLAFSYILIIFAILTIYADIRLSSVVAWIAVGINVGVIVKAYFEGGLDSSLVAQGKVMIIVTLLGAFFTILATKTSHAIARKKMETINKEKESASKMLATIMEVSESVIKDISDMAIKMEEVTVSIHTTKSSMDDVATGSNETAEAIQMQQENTEEINTHIGSVKTSSSDILSNVKTTEAIVQEGRTIMQELMQQAEETEATSKEVATQMEDLKTYTSQMQGITELINNVTSQTALLALNASIEAARAGEAGRGFAVVATEISNLADQTSAATNDITQIIINISNSLEEVVTTVTALLDSNTKQNAQVSETASKFEIISDNTTNIYEQSMVMNETVETVSNANTTIVESITNISAITQEVTARALETLDGTKDDTERVEMIAELVKSLERSANILQTIETM